MALTYPAALVLLAALPIAWWLGRRASARAAAPHPLWFLLAPGPPALAGARGGHFSRVPLALRLAALTALAVAAAAPVHAPSRPDVAAVAAKGAPVAALVIVVAARFAPEPLRPAAGSFLVRLRRAASAAPRDVYVVASAVGSGELWRRRVRPASDEVGTLLEVPYAGAGGLRVALSIEPSGEGSGEAAGEGVGEAAGQAAGEAAGTGGPRGPSGAVIVEVPPLGPRRVVLRAAAPGGAVERALRVLPTVRLVEAEAAADVLVADRVELAAGEALPGGAHALLWFDPAAAPAAPAAIAGPHPLLAVAHGPLVGLTPAALAEATVPRVAPARVPPPPASAPATPAARPLEDVWLRAGPHAAVYRTTIGAAPAVVVALPPDEGSAFVLPVLLADLFAAAPLYPGVPAAEPAAAAVAVAASAAGPAPPSVWPVRALLALALALLLAELWAARPARAALAIRLAALLASVLALALGVAASRRTVFAVDVSASLGGAAASAAVSAELARRAAALPPDGEAAVIVFGATPAVAVPPGEPAAVTEWARRPGAAIVDASRTDLVLALRTAAGLAGFGQEVVVLTDGHDTAGGLVAARHALAAAAADGVRVEAVAVARGDRVRLQATPEPTFATAGVSFALPLIIDAAGASLDPPLALRLAVRAGGDRVAERELLVRPGRTTVTVPVTLRSAGLVVLDARLEAPPGDAVPEDDAALVPIVVAGPPRTLRVDASSVAALAADAGALTALDLVVLDDVPFDTMGAARAAALGAFVARGGTLLAAGAEAAFGPGGWSGTALDALLPLRADPRPSGDRTALVILVDRSGSMGEPDARTRAPAAVDLASLAGRLRPTDLVGLVAFDTAPHALVALGPPASSPFAPGAPAPAPASAPGALVPRGPFPDLPPPRGATDPAPAIELARAWLASAPPAARRLAVLVSDGRFAARAAATLDAVDDLVAAGARLAVVSAGSPDPEARALLGALAARGGGPLLDAADPLATGAALRGPLPSLLAAPPGTRPLVVRDPAAPALRDAFRVLLGAAPAPFGAAGAPLLPLHARTAAAPDAVIVADAGGDPLLAARRSGAGWALAFAAPLHAPTPPALSDEIIAAASRLAATVPPAGAARIDRDGSAVVLTLVLDPSSYPSLPAAYRIDAVDPSGAGQTLALVAEGLGRFSARLPAPRPGLHVAYTPVGRLAFVLPDPERAGPDVDADFFAPVSPAPAASALVPPPRVRPRLAVLAALAIGLLLAALTAYRSLPRAPRAH